MRHAVRALALCLSGALLVVIGTNVIVRADERGRSHAAIGATPARAVAIVPGSPTSQGLVKAALLSRLEGALALYRDGEARAILVSGVNSARDPETTAMRSWLEARGVPPRDILSDDQGTRTRQTMLRASRVYAVDRAIVCTEALHMPRALFLAKRNGIDAVGHQVPGPRKESRRRIVVEALKTTLAVLEETVAPLSGGGEAPSISVR